MTAILMKGILGFAYQVPLGKEDTIVKKLAERPKGRTLMHNLFGDQFLRLFTGDLQNRRKRTTSKVRDQNPEAKTERDAEQVPPTSEEGRVKNLTDANHSLNEEDQNKKKGTKL